MSPFRAVFPRGKTLIGVIHLPPLPGYPDSPGIERIVEKALADLDALEAGGADGVLVENEEDRPHRVLAARETIAAMTRVTTALVAASRRVKIGAEILLNDPEASLAVARMSGALFIRTDYFVDPMERPEHGGEMHIDPERLMDYRKSIGASNVLVLADIQVKYARMLVERTLSESARLAQKKGADAIVVTGTVTGEPPTRETLEQAKKGAGRVPVLVGSGLDVSNARPLLEIADGAIVGTSLKHEGAVDARRVEALARAIRGGTSGLPPKLTRRKTR